MKHTIQRFLFTLCIALIFANASAQTPQAFNYQGVARDAAGTPIANRTISVLFTISFKTAVDDLWSSVYQESQVLTTNNLGLFSAKVGTASPGGHGFSDIAWGAPGSYYLELAIDMAGGTSYVPVGAPTQLISVPYALHAATCDEVAGGLNWVENPNNPGTIINSNENTVIITPNDPCCMFYSPDLLQSALIVDAQDKMTGAYFTTNNLGLDASAIKAEIIGNAGLYHSDPAAIRGKAIITGGDGVGGVGGEFEGGEHGLIARSSTGKAGLFEGDVEISKNLDIAGRSTSNLLMVRSAHPALFFDKLSSPETQSFSLEGFNGDSRKLQLNYSYAHPASGAYIQPLMSFDHQGRMSVGTDNAGNYAMRVQQNANYGFALTKDGGLNNTWEFYLGGVDTLGKKRLQLYAANAFVGQFNPVTGAYARFSDRKFKRDIRPLGQIMTAVKQLNLVTYQTEQDASGARQSGVIAQELEQVFPEFVTVGQDRDGNEVRSVDYAGLSVVALKAIQEQELRLEKLEKANAELMLRLAKLEAKK